MLVPHSQSQHISLVSLLSVLALGHSQPCLFTVLIEQRLPILETFVDLRRIETVIIWRLELNPPRFCIFGKIIN